MGWEGGREGGREGVSEGGRVGGRVFRINVSGVSWETIVLSLVPAAH